MWFDALVGAIVYTWTKYFVLKRRTTKVRGAAAAYFRAFVLLIVFALTLIGIYYSFPAMANWLSSMGMEKKDFVEFGKGLAYPLLVIAGLPVLFFLWAFRDANAREKLANDRKDVNLKEFQELQSRAAGLFSPELPSAAVESLQIASIYQLAGFLRGEYGQSFQRPTFEALRVLARQFSIRNGSQPLMDRIERAKKVYERRYRNKSIDPIKASRFLMSVRRSAREIDQGASHSPPVRVLALNVKSYNESVPLIKIQMYRFVSSKINWSSVIFTEATFVNSHFAYSRFEKSMIQKSNFYISSIVLCNFDYSFTFSTTFLGCNIQRVLARRAQFQSCRFVQSMISNSDFRFTDFEQCDFRHAQLRKVDLRGAILKEAKMSGASLNEVDFRGCDLRAIDPNTIASALGSRMDNATLVCLRLDHREGGPFEIDVEGAKAGWIAKGAVFET